MKRISGSTFFYKKLLPLFLLWPLCLGLYQIIWAKDQAQSPTALLIPMLFVLVVGGLIFKKLFWDLADEAIDNGDELLFRNGRKQQTVKLADIINISSSQMTSPERVTITTRTAGELGDELSFILPMRFNLFSTHPLVRNLIERVDKARRHAWQETQQ